MVSISFLTNPCFGDRLRARHRFCHRLGWRIGPLRGPPERALDRRPSVASLPSHTLCRCRARAPRMERSRVGEHVPAQAFDRLQSPSHPSCMPAALPSVGRQRPSTRQFDGWLPPDAAHRLRYSGAMMALPGISGRPLRAVIRGYEPRLHATRPAAAVPQAPSRDRELGVHATEASPFMLRRFKLHIATIVPTAHPSGRFPSALGNAPGALLGRCPRSLLERVADVRHVPQVRLEPTVTGRSRTPGGALAWGRGFVQQGVSAIRHNAAAGNA